MHAAYCDTDVHIIQFLVSTYRQQTVEIIPKVPFTKTKRVRLRLERVSRFNSSVFRKGKKAYSRRAVKLSNRGENKAHKNKKYFFEEQEQEQVRTRGLHFIHDTCSIVLKPNRSTSSSSWWWWWCSLLLHGENASVEKRGTGRSSKRTSKPLALPGSVCQCLPNLPLPVSEIPNVRDLSSFCEESYYSVGNR